MRRVATRLRALCSWLESPIIGAIRLCRRVRGQSCDTPTKETSKRHPRERNPTMIQRPMAAIAIASWRSVGIALLSPPIAILSAAILVGLLGIFVLWLMVVATLVTAIVLADLAHGLMRRIARPPIGAVDQRAVGLTGPS